MDNSYLDNIIDSPLFYDIGKEDLAHIFSCLQPKIKKYDKTELITLESDDYTGIGVLISGEALVTKENELGERHVITKLNQGNIFGEMVAYTKRQKWPATIISNSKCTVMFISPESIISTCENLCMGHKKMMTNLIRLISEKALMLNKKMEYLSIKNMRGKISKYLYDQSKINSSKSFTIPLNRNEMADYLNVSRPSMSRELGRMSKENIISFSKNNFKILAYELLKESIYNN